MSKMTNKDLKNLKVALVAEELTQLGGAERVLDCFIELFPKAPIYTIVYDKKKTESKYRGKVIRTSFIQELPLGVKKYKWYLPLMPLAIEWLDLRGYDLVLSVTSALVKGVIIKKPTIHICYCNTPTRYLWFDSADYIKNAPIPFFVRPLMPLVLRFLRKWDLRASERPDYYIANSENVQKRIKKYYKRDSLAIFPPVEAKKFKLINGPGKHFLIVSRIEPYKKVDMVIKAFKELKLPLKVVGSGTKIEEYQKNLSKNIEFVGRVSDERLAGYYENAVATIFPQEEDAGIVPLESMAAGRPIIAYAKGGALETIINKKTGLFFSPQTKKALIQAIKNFQKMKFSQKEIRKRALQFDKDLFKKKILKYINSKLDIKNTR